MAATKKKKLTQREKALRAQVRKELRAKGIIPPVKTRLNRKKFMEEVLGEWNGKDEPLYGYLIAAISWMLPADWEAVTPEQVGVLKVLKIALEQHKFEKALPEGVSKYNAADFYKEVVDPIINL